MNINRDNYETIFLLYIDNELSVAERKTVEEFVAQNPDLQAELQQLQDVVLTPDELPVFDKNSLLRTSLAEDTMEEKMLMLLDKELDEEEAGALQKTIGADAYLQKEWNILQLATLDADDKVIFEQKHLLYRKEKDNVVAGRFVRWAVAAVLIGAGFFATITFINNKETANPGTASIKTEGSGSELATKTESVDQQKNSASTAPETANSNTADVKAITPDDVQAEERKPRQQMASNKEVKVPVEKVLPLTKKEIPEETPLLAVHKSQQVEKISPEKTNEEMAISALQKKPDLRDINMLDVQKNSIASTASLTEETNDDRILYLNEEDVSRTKAAGFFRKIKRTITRKANIKTGNGLKIAGFEIALK
ncbi:anti-sigma factor [Ferruginibacter sp. HRS2-29]|uniref:anti-sigma factor family protein n=1 Tax=Ferruginibacter sp. HRS2-29 TaxID=2487334 RepID=UPI0020CDC49F|nr:hypothetical protein [Ferruginibacter sp. HRS2-29]MCP9752673.1 hypothetical protein [Ferruginibacter sp. HRS2-29]